jgi:Tat protein secretion system quality control protein TatD with DNase activity
MGIVQPDEIQTTVIDRPQKPQNIEPRPMDKVQSIVPSQQKKLLSAFDSHFHLYRTCTKIWGSVVGRRPKDIITYGTTNSRPELPVNVCGGVMIFSEPSNYHHIPSTLECWKLAVGIHPKHVKEFSDNQFQRLQELLKLPTTSALGEVGLDRSVPIKEWILHEAVLTKVLKCAIPEKCLVLHLRGHSVDRYGMDVSARCLRILDSTITRRQLIHLHCFTGDQELVTEWLNSYPHTYFGFTGLVQTFDHHQVEALRAIPKDRLLIGTDS